MVVSSHVVKCNKKAMVEKDPVIGKMLLKCISTVPPILTGIRPKCDVLNRSSASAPDTM
jgi:hypothetical protein